MTAEAPSSVSGDDSQQSVVGMEERSAGDGPAGQGGSFSHLPRRTAGSHNSNGSHPHATDDPAATDDRATADDRAGAEGPTVNGRTRATSRATVDNAADGAVTDDPTDATAKDATAKDATAKDATAKDATTDGAVTDGAVTDGRAKTADRAADDGPKADEQLAAERRTRAKDGAATRTRSTATADTTADDSADDQTTLDNRAATADPVTTDRAADNDTENSAKNGTENDTSKDSENDTENEASKTGADSIDASPDADHSSASVDTEPTEYAGEGGVRMDTAVQEVVDAVADDPWIRTLDETVIAEEVIEDDIVAAEVAHQFEAVVGDEAEAEPAEFAATAVLDVLRASGWADVAEATELRAESARLRELLAEVIRDHRAREASTAGTENQQLHWLVPLLRAAHGVAFGSLGAKVALRTAVQDVPPEVLASAGLRIDYGVPHDYEDDHR